MQKINVFKKERDVRIDIMKGIGIMLVVYGHINHNNSFVYLFHMPLFFILSGAALSLSTHKYSVKRRFKAIMVPYFVFSILSFVYWALIESKFRPVHDDTLFHGILGELPIKWQQFINIFLALNCSDAFIYNVVLWFLPCLFMADLIFAYIDKKKWVSIGILGIVCLFFLFFSKATSLPWCMHLSLISVPFIWIGKISYKPLMKWLEYHKSSYIPFFFIFLGLILSIYYLFHPGINMYGNSVSPFYLFYLSALVGTLLVVFLSLIIDKYVILGGHFFAYFGKNSLIVMCIHEPLKRILLVVCSKIICIPVETMRDNWIISVGCTLILLFVCILFIEIINKKMKWIIGKK